MQSFPYKGFHITIKEDDGFFTYCVDKDGEDCIFMSEYFNSFYDAKKAAKKHVTRGLVFMEGRNAMRARRGLQSRTKVANWREDLETGGWTSSFEDGQSIFEIVLVPEGNRWYWSIYRDGQELQEGDYLDTLNLATIQRVLENKVKDMSRTYSRRRQAIRGFDNYPEGHGRINRRQANYTVRVIWEGELLSQQDFSDENEAYDHFDVMVDATDLESDSSGTTVQIIQGDDVLGERHFAKTTRRANLASRRKASIDFESMSTEDLQWRLEFLKDAIQLGIGNDEASDTAWKSIDSIMNILKSRGVISMNRRAMKRSATMRRKSNEPPYAKLFYDLEDLIQDMSNDPMVPPTGLGQFESNLNRGAEDPSLIVLAINDFIRDYGDRIPSWQKESLMEFAEEFEKYHRDGVHERRSRRSMNRAANLSKDEIQGLAGRCQDIAYEMGITDISFDEWVDAANETVEYFQSEGIPLNMDELETETLAVYIDGV